MTLGLLEILIVEANGLPGKDFIDKIDPYVKVYYKDQEKSTSIARGQGKNPKWNAAMKFMAEYPGSGGDYKLLFKVMDHDTFSSDDFLCQTIVHVDDLLSLGVEHGYYNMRNTKYRLDDGKGAYCGDIKIRIKYSSKANEGNDNDDEGEELGGWKSSDFE